MMGGEGCIEVKESIEVYDTFKAHVDPKTREWQSVSSHLANVQKLIKENCPLPILVNLGELAGAMHDCGKYCHDFQDYMEDIIKYGEDAKARNVDHSTAGGRYFTQMSDGRFAAKALSLVIYSHHGLLDCIKFESGLALEEERSKKSIDYDTITERCFIYQNESDIRSQFADAIKDMDTIIGQINAIIGKDTEAVYGMKNFYLGMFVRVLLSLLIDSDWTDTAANAQNTAPPKRWSQYETCLIWEESIKNMEKHLLAMSQNVSKKSVLNPLRQEISDQCKRAAVVSTRLYRLTVPTGSGKTLSSLRFALYHASYFHRQHIFYVAPFNSILEQNADEIRRAVGIKNIVLEHHCNIVKENVKEDEQYRKLTETWDSPIIVTTAVQILNALFSGEKRDIRRMYNLCNSVIIFDEVQAIPVRCMELFNLAVNFLSAFCDSTIVLCSATQPSLAKLPHNRVFNCGDLVGNYSIYNNEFKRTKIYDRTDIIPGGMAISDMKNFVEEQLVEQRSILIIVNTKSCARNLYNALRANYGESLDLYHLSTYMCAKNRQDELESIKQALLIPDRKVICVSTQLVEAGVDFSFSCVIRSLAGLDNIIQAAGRCNRHKECDGMGKVFIVKMSPEAEHLSSLKDIKDAQDAMGQLLYQSRMKPEPLEEWLDSQEAIRCYYSLYFSKKVEFETKYPCSGNADMNLVDLLSDNRAGCHQYFRVHGKKAPNVLNQAFKTAGEIFRVIQDDEKIQVIVEYDDKAKVLISDLEDPYLTLDQKKLKLRKLQCYTVGISESIKRRLSGAVREICKGTVFVLSENYYDYKTGVSEIPVLKELQF